MTDHVSAFMADVKAKNPAEPEFHQAVQEVADSRSVVRIVTRNLGKQDPRAAREPERVAVSRDVGGDRGRSCQSGYGSQ